MIGGLCISDLPNHMELLILCWEGKVGYRWGRQPGGGVPIPVGPKQGAGSMDLHKCDGFLAKTLIYT